MGVRANYVDWLQDKLRQLLVPRWPPAAASPLTALAHIGDHTVAMKLASCSFLHC
jgi:hypothetical protein